MPQPLHTFCLGELWRPWYTGLRVALLAGGSLSSNAAGTEAVVADCPPLLALDSPPLIALESRPTAYWVSTALDSPPLLALESPPIACRVSEPFDHL